MRIRITTMIILGLVFAAGLAFAAEMEKEKEPVR